jgi:hypothetical protein
MTTTAVPTNHPVVGSVPSAVVYVDSEHAIVVKTTIDGAVAVTDIKRRRPEDLSYLVRIVDEIGERRRVAIAGPDHLRLEVEREYVSLNHRPDLLVDVEPDGPEDAAALTGRLAELAA